MEYAKPWKEVNAVLYQKMMHSRATNKLKRQIMQKKKLNEDTTDLELELQKVIDTSEN